ncbi:MAG TPA: ABC transporter permease [Candidatus Dormibacteraeota bacterium]|nr:ABC transporter permease [Candidatus Dormibacteraeota bacterium]
MVVAPPLGPVARTWAGFSTAVRLGWAVSSNWTRPLLFVIYIVLRPISAALILVVMYEVITGGRGSAFNYLSFLVVGTAFWAFVNEGVSEFAVGILEDRGRFKMLKYAYLAPMPFPVFLVGRAASKLTSAAASVLIVLVVATVGLRLPINPLNVNYGLLAIACLLAFISLMAFSIALSMILLAGRDAYGYGEIMAQVLYIFSGAIFPISVLPGPLAFLASLSPLVYWLELTRRAILHGRVYQMFPGLSDGQVLLRLSLATVGTVALGYLAYSWADRQARRKGYIDMDANS